MRTSLPWPVLALLVAWPRPASAQGASQETAGIEGEDDAAPAPYDETIVVVGATPVHGSEVPREKIAANVQVATAADLARTHGQGLADFMYESLASVTANQVQGNPFQPDVQFRGFTASPLLGTAQGLAAYVDGVRVNEVFGDTLGWDLIPENAISDINLIPGSNPMFGLNTLGGALSILTKTGWSHPGLRAELSGGSAWRRSLEVEAGGSTPRLGYYLAGTLFAEEGWRDHSPSELRQLFGSFGWRGDGAALDLSLVTAWSALTGNGAAPVQLLDDRRSAVFTYPDDTRNAAAGATLRGTRVLDPGVTLTANAYLRALWTTTSNGDASDLEECASPASVGLLCREEGGEESLVLDTAGNAVPFDPARPVDAVRNLTRTAQQAQGATVQASVARPVRGHGSHLVVGASYGGGSALFSSRAELGWLSADRSTAGSGIVEGDSLVELVTRSHHLGAYFTDVLDILPALSLTLAGRLGWSWVRLEDLLGGELDGLHRFPSFNPAIGLTYQPWRWLGVHASYGSSSRAPTPVELSCADEDDPCRLPGAFVADPPLEQVVAWTAEGGVRGRVALGKGHLRYSAALFRTASQNDILFISGGTLVSEGFFSNVGQTLRQGVELAASGATGTLGKLADLPVSVSGRVRYSHLRATFGTSFQALSPHHPAADASGRVLVPRGATIPGVPDHVAKADVALHLGEVTSIGAGAVYSSGQHLRGDEANLLDRVPGYLLVSLVGELRAGKHLGAFIKVSNLFDRRHATFGVLSGATDVLGPSYDDPRFLGPGAPRTFWAGISASL